MAMQTDVKASVALTSTGQFTDQNTNALGRVRVKAIYIIPGASAGSVTLKDGGSGGATVVVINTVASATQPTYMLFPGQGLLFETNVHGTISNVGSAVVFYG
jgi:uncharacterized metal-binding protein